MANTDEEKKNNYKIIDLFAGIGGIRMGFEHGFAKAGGIAECVFTSEWDKYANITYKENFGDEEIAGDITKVDASDIPDFDIVCAGFPCFTGETLVRCDDGYKLISDIEPGDMVLTHRGRYRRVIACMSHLADNVIEIEEKRGISVRCTEDHPFLAFDEEEMIACRDPKEWDEWVRADDLVGKKEYYAAVLGEFMLASVGDANGFESDDFVITYVTEKRYLKGEHIVYNLEVEEDNSYTANGFAVHNCQSFSSAGKRQGFNDNYKGRCRGTLFLEVARIAEHHKPEVIFCENVKGLVRHDKGNTYKVIKQTFEEIGYTVFDKVLNSKDFGCAQNRERIYIVAFRNDIAPENFEFPESNGKQAALRDILDTAPVPSKYYLSDTYLNACREHKKRHAAKGNGFGYIIRDLDGVAGTITCGGSGKEGNLIIDHREHSMIPTTKIKGEINKEDVRRTTPREWARMQGFPDDYKIPVSDAQAYKQFGNSVSIPVIEAIAEKIYEVLDAAGEQIEGTGSDGDNE